MALWKLELPTRRRASSSLGEGPPGLDLDDITLAPSASAAPPAGQPWLKGLLSFCLAPVAAPHPVDDGDGERSADSLGKASSMSFHRCLPKPAPAPKPAAAPAAPCGAAPSFLVGRSAKTYETSGEGLRDAVKSGDLKGVREVLSRDASLANYQDRQMESMLHLSAIFNHASIAVELVKNGAKIDVKNQDQETPLDVALPSLKAKIQAEYDKAHAA